MRRATRDSRERTFAAGSPQVLAVVNVRELTGVSSFPLMLAGLYRPKLVLTLTRVGLSACAA